MGLIERLFQERPSVEPMKKRAQRLSTSELVLWSDNLVSGIGQLLHSSDVASLEEAEEQSVALLVVIQTLRAR